MSVPVVGKRLAGVQGFINEVLVAATVELVSTGFERNVHDCVAGLPKLRRVITGLNREFLDRVRSRLTLLRCALAETVGRVHALDHYHVGVVCAAVDANDRADLSGSDCQCRAWNQSSDCKRVPDAAAAGEGACLQNRKIVDAFCSNDMAQFSALGLQQRRVGLHGDRLRGAADLEPNIDSNGLRRLNRQTLPDVFLESVQLCRELINARRQLRQCEISGFSADGVIFRPGFDICCNDTRPGNDGVRRIGHSSSNRTPIGLSECRPRIGSQKQADQPSSTYLHDCSPLSLVYGRSLKTREATVKRDNQSLCTGNQNSGDGCRIRSTGISSVCLLYFRSQYQSQEF